MKLFLIINGQVHEDISELFDSIEEAKASYGIDEYQFDYAPNYVIPGWTYDNGQWIEPTMTGYAYDRADGCFYSHDKYREILHERTSNDTLQAMRKIREGGTAYDWSAWLDKLDAYNLAVEKTKEQATYPDVVEYPEYPSK